jgi:hypothetical protein
MRDAIRWGVIAVAVVGSSLIGTGVRAGDDPSSANQAAAMEASSQTEAAPAQGEPVRQESGAGAASAEPEQAGDQDASARAHQAWVDSIHNTP